MLLSDTVKAMEAMVAERGTEVTEWNDGRRLDDLSKRVDDLGARMDLGFAQVHQDIQELNGRFDALQRTRVQMMTVMLAALIGFIATQI
jgi:hypothetical protein